MGGSGGESSTGSTVIGPTTLSSLVHVPGENFPSLFKSFIKSEPQPSLLHVECPVAFMFDWECKVNWDLQNCLDATPGNGGSSYSHHAPARTSLEVTLILPLHSGGSEQPSKKYPQKTVAWINPKHDPMCNPRAFFADSSNINIMSGGGVPMHLAAASHHPTTTFLPTLHAAFPGPVHIVLCIRPFLSGFCQRLVGEPPTCCKAASRVRPDAAGSGCTP